MKWIYSFSSSFSSSISATTETVEKQAPNLHNQLAVELTEKKKKFRSSSILALPTVQLQPMDGWVFDQSSQYSFKERRQWKRVS